MRRRIAVLVCSSLLAVPRPARADGELWVWVENRVPVLRAERPTFPRIDWRFVGDFRVNKRSEGLNQAFLRTGPLFFVTDWLFVATQGTVYADRVKDGVHQTEARTELEPNLFGRIGDFTFNDRSRFESRWRTDSEHRWRYRNQLRINYAPVGAKWIPYAWNEVLWDLSGLGVNQNRLQFGLARMLNTTTRLDVGYMIRSREDAMGNWAHDHILNLYLFLDPPPR
ncbi:MAG: DUF2490 domain-containing protein [Labilithrix sp.]|nr:DUF2490 domain-containing protein [Labilithrix sp.]MCW5815712.1 DUF2490 domain-containing protein [Labilithrix sp.]